jgi:phosphoglycolate phosphatase
MKAKPQHLLLDLDGTLTDPAPGIVASYQYVIEQLRLPARSDEDLRRFIGPPLRHALRELLDTADVARIEHAVLLYRERFASSGLYQNAIYPGIAELLATWRAASHELFIVTSKATVYATEILRHFGIAAHFNAVHGAELSGERSEKTELIAHLLQQHSIEPEAACMIGDRRHDIVGAKAHGIRAVGVLWGYGSREELVDAGADAIVERIDQLSTLFAPSLEPSSG